MWSFIIVVCAQYAMCRVGTFKEDNFSEKQTIYQGQVNVR